jgi:glycerophosphoryl diester phosphodiesterase
MPTRLPARRVPTIGFAHRGARAHVHENTLDAFLLARRLGVTGLETDAWVTRDGVIVLDHDGEFGHIRKRRIKDCERSELPEYVPTLADLYSTCGTDYELSIDVKDPNAAEGIVAVAKSFGATPRLWLCHPDWRLVASWRPLDRDCRLVDSTRWRAIKEGGERRLATLAAAGIDALNMHVTDWSGGIVALVHRFELFAFGWDAQHERQLVELVDMGIDGIFSDYSDRMMDVINRFYAG